MYCSSPESLYPKQHSNAYKLILSHLYRSPLHTRCGIRQISINKTLEVTSNPPMKSPQFYPSPRDTSHVLSHKSIYKIPGDCDAIYIDESSLASTRLAEHFSMNTTKFI